MDYDAVELIVGSVLALLPIIALTAYGIWSMKKPPSRMPLYFFVGLVASLAYIWGAGSLAIMLFPPPYDAYFAGGRGLDLRGMIIAFGAMLGGAAGLVTTMIICALNTIRLHELRRAASRAAG